MRVGMEYTCKRHKKILMMGSNVIKSQSEKGRRENLQQGPALAHQCTCEQGTYSLFVGMLRYQKIIKFQKSIIQRCKFLQKFTRMMNQFSFKSMIKISRPSNPVSFLAALLLLYTMVILSFQIFLLLYLAFYLHLLLK